MNDTVKELKNKAPISNDAILESAKKHQKSLRQYALKNKRLNPDGSIDKGWLEDVSKGDDIWGKRARLVATMKEMHKDSEKENPKRTPEEK